MLNNKIGATTEIRIVPSKPFAALSEKHDASDLKIGAPDNKMIASSSELLWSDDLLHGAAEKVGAPATNADAPRKKIGATEENGW